MSDILSLVSVRLQANGVRPKVDDYIKLVQFLAVPTPNIQMKLKIFLSWNTLAYSDNFSKKCLPVTNILFNVMFHSPISFFISENYKC